MSDSGFNSTAVQDSTDKVPVERIRITHFNRQNVSNQWVTLKFSIEIR